LTSISDEDAEIVALIDDQLDQGARARLLARLAADETLRQRYEELRDAGAPIAAAFDALIEQAPLPRLRAALEPELARRAPTRRFATIAFRDLAAGIVGFLLGAGAAAWIALSVAPSADEGDWRSAVENYTNLYNNETFGPLHPDAALQAGELSAVGARVDAKLTPETVALPGLRFTVAFMLSFRGAPLAAIAFVDASDAPVLLCIIDNHAPDADLRSERRGELSLASWSRGGRGYLVIGRIPEAQAVALAGLLERRI
jgi:anti-sigma factor RsiW